MVGGGEGRGETEVEAGRKAWCISIAGMEGVGVSGVGAAVLERGARESLGCGLVRNAVFLAERAAAVRAAEAQEQARIRAQGRGDGEALGDVVDEGCVRLLGACYVAAGRVQEAAAVLKRCEEGQSRYEYAVVCHRLGRAKEAEAALTTGAFGEGGGGEGVVHGGAAGHYLMGCLCKASERKSLAVHHLTAALKLDPLLWVAYEELCGLNEIEGIDVGAVYGAAAAAVVGERMGRDGAAGGGAPGAGAGWAWPPPGVDAARRAAGVGRAKRAYVGVEAPRTGPGPVPLPSGGGVRSAGPPPPPPAKARPTAAAGKSASGFGTPGSGWTPASFSRAAPEMTPVQHFVEETPRGEMEPAGGGDGGLDFATPLEAGGAPPPGPPPPLHQPAGPGQQQQQQREWRKWMDEGKMRKVSGNLFGRDEGPPGSAFEEPDGASSEVTPASHMFSVGGGGHASMTGKQTRPSTAVTKHGTAEGPPVLAGKAGHRMAFATPATAAGLGSVLSFDGDEPMACEGDDDDEEEERMLMGGEEFMGGANGDRAPLSSLATRPHGRGGEGEGATPASFWGAEEWAAGSRECVGLLRQLGEAYRLMSLHQSREALASFARLGREQYATGWVLSNVGRCRLEMGEHAEAADAFAWSRKVAPARLEGLELYSTALWHLRKEVDLSALAQSATELERRSPQAWCCVGNCFSLQREHEAALRFFQRAIAIDPGFTYAHTLCGHEHAASEDFEKALGCYRTALKLDARHYNAWYGLGAIYQRQEKHELAEYHFRRALKINPRSSVLRCYLGMSMHRLNRDAEALNELDAALQVDPKNPLALFERASVLVTMDRLHEALEVLEALKELAPKESSIFFMMGKIHKRLRDVDSAVACLSTALDLKPNNADVHAIKTSLDRVNALDDDENDDI